MKKIFSLFLLIYLIPSLTVSGQDQEWKVIDTSGNVLFTSKAKYVSSFKNGMAKVYMQEWNGKEWIQGYGFVNKKGDLKIPGIYYSAQDFYDSLVTWVQDNDKKWHLINRNGKIISTKNYSKVGYFFEMNNGLSAVYEGDNMGFINREGKEVIPCEYGGAGAFHENRACVYSVKNPKELYGFIDRTGKLVIPYQFSQAGISQFFKGTCRVKKAGGRTYLIDTMGNPVFKTKYGSLQDMNFGLAPVSLGNAYDKWRFVNENDEFKLGGPYDFTKSFNENGWTEVELKEKKGVIDTTGKEILPIKYDIVYYDLKNDGYICGVYGERDQPKSMIESEKDYFLDGMKKLEMEVAYLQSANGSDRILFCTKDRKIGYMDRTGEIKIIASYTRGFQFSDGCTWVKK